MAFWGLEVKPGKPVTHKFDQARGRLHISQASLGLGSATKKSVVQCIVGDKTPVILCVLLPDNTESCHLALEFEEAEDVVFAVIGPRSVHLTGYYLGGRHPIHNDSSESYGVDIANSDAEESVHGSEEDSYDDSFINDDEPEVFSPSPLSSDIASDDEMPDKKKPKARKSSRKRLTKRYKSIESDDESNSQLHNHMTDSVPKSNDEDSPPISTLFKSRAVHGEEKPEKKISKTSDKIENGGSHLQTQDKSGHDKKTDGWSSIFDNLGANHSKSKTIRKEKTKEAPEADGEIHDKAIKDEKTFQDNLGANQSKSKKKRKERTKETPEANGKIHNDAIIDEKTFQDETEEKRPATEREGDQTSDALLPSSKSDEGKDVRPKKRRRKSSEEESSVPHPTLDNVIQNGKLKQEGESQNSGNDISMENKDQKLPNHENNDIASSPAVQKNQLKDKKSKKKKNRTRGKEENEVIGVGTLSESDKNKSNSGSGDKNVESKSSEARTLSNGLIIEDLKTGEPDGKLATSGKKIKVQYVGKLRDEGHIFDTNIGKSPLKLRLGAESVPKGWNVGLNGMRVGGKRRITIPPTIGDESQGAGENVPPNSWLEYEIELVGVR